MADRIYEPGKAPVIVTDQIITGTAPIDGFEFNSADVWSCYEL